MSKKVLPFPGPPQQVETPMPCHHSRVNVRVDGQHGHGDTVENTAEFYPAFNQADGKGRVGSPVQPQLQFAELAARGWGRELAGGRGHRVWFRVEAAGGIADPGL